MSRPKVVYLPEQNFSDEAGYVLIAIPKEYVLREVTYHEDVYMSDVKETMTVVKVKANRRVL